MTDEVEITEENIDSVFNLFQTHGDSLYVGEIINQTSHAIQCAMLAEQDKQPPEVVLGLLLHDIGTIYGYAIGSNPIYHNGEYLGPTDHDLIGEQFLQNKGFPDTICSFASGHVQAMRYKIYASQEYKHELSWASGTFNDEYLDPMTAEEAKEFEGRPDFQMMVKARGWDEQGKKTDVKLEPLEKYRKMAKDYLLHR